MTPRIRFPSRESIAGHLATDHRIETHLDKYRLLMARHARTHPYRTGGERWVREHPMT